MATSELFCTDFKFAKWMLEYLKKQMELNYIDKDSKRSFGAGMLQGKIDIWQDICAILCPSHIYEVVEEDPEYNYKVEACKICGHIFDAEGYNLDYKDYYVRSCKNCKHLKAENDDISIGTTKIKIHINEYCINPVFENMTTKQAEFMIGQDKCEYWEGREYVKPF